MMAIWTRILVEELVRNRQMEGIFDKKMSEPVQQYFIGDMFRITIWLIKDNININNNNKTKSTPIDLECARDYSNNFTSIN